jgi:hypothetical protein
VSIRANAGRGWGIGMEIPESFLQDFAQAALGAAAAALVTGVIAFLSTRIPRVREWFIAERLPLIAAFLMSVVVAGAIGLFLRHLTWQELQPLKQELASVNGGVAIFAGGRVDPTAAPADGCDNPIKSGIFRVAKVGEGNYRVCFGDQLPEDSIILTGPVLGRTDKAANTVSVRVVSSGRSSFEALTLFNGNATDRAFGFLIFRGTGSH